MTNRRKFIRAGALFVPAVFGIFVPKVSAARRWIPKIASVGGGLTIATIDPQSAANGAAGTLTHSLTGVPAGALLVVTAADEADASDGALTVAGGSLTWTSRANASASSSGNARIYTAVFAAGGSISVTVSVAGTPTLARSSVCYVVTGQESTLGGASPTALTAANQPNISITTTRVNSLVFCACSDWAARAGTPTARLGTIALNHDATTGNYRGVHIYHSATSATSYGEGYTGANTGGNNACGVVAYEIRTP
jgi:hypothetical protein